LRPGRSGSNLTPRSTASTIWLLGLLCAVLVLPLASPLWGGSQQDWRAALRYERAGVLAGEYWRLLTAHLIHGDLRHLGLNLAGLGLLAALFPRAYTAAGSLLIVLGSIAAIDLGLVFLEPQLDWYLGLSGVLHGLLAAGALSWWRRESKSFALVITTILVAKLAWEQTHSALPLSGDMPVVVDAHLYGALGGAVAATLLWRRAQDWWRMSRSL